ncbi:Golgi transport complex subunit 3 [Exophiala xenobiotica]|uniref:Conserved oligomeric Golgi complex subunit 3 n=1 Tax=Lithohypha guttulata TaxID=1690604 RepID=A0ABR0K728_9EURO|nr:Golgi transport complex subunit 3 [Lithohypha guttulata]KAK5317302.1 Golgi transport complex subunit 3 [Exophiala xenobiotica]
MASSNSPTLNEHNELQDQSLPEIENELDLLQLDEDEILEASLNEYQRYLDELDAAKSYLDQLLASTTATLDQLADISKAFRSVDQQTSAFQAKSASILEEQRQNDRLATDLAENLKYYEPLERITRRMNAPGAGNFVRTQDFRDMLLTLDECIDYMQTHPKQKEAELYRSRYKQLLTRALTLVRNTFMAGARDVTDEVGRRITDKQANVNETLLSSLLYAKFRVDAPLMKDLGLEIQKRAVPPADADPGTEGEYQSLMNELHQAFATCRFKLMLPIIQQKVSQIATAPTARDLVAFARSSITYVRGVCLDEFELWEEWFHGQRGVYDFLETLCEPLFDQLRPKIIHETKLSKLCSLVTLLQTRYLNTDDEDEAPDPTQLDFASLIQPALEDAQTRLVFRTLALLRDEIEYYKPTTEDLDYPRRVSEAPTPKSAAPLSGRKTSNIAAATEDDSGDESTPNIWSRNRLLELSYPTLPRAIRLLSRIYRLVNSSVFDDLAHQIVHSTTHSLVNASNQISTKSSPMDAQLFLLRHLLLLKSQIVAFDIEYVSSDVQFDFSGMTSTFYELRDRGGLFNPRSWVRLFTSGGLIPRVVENMLDAKAELDGQLRTVINDFTAGFAKTMTSSLKTTSKPEDATAAVREKVQKEVPILRAKLEQYLDDLRTRETLVAAVEDQVVQAYEAFFEEYAGKAAAGGKGQPNGSVSGKTKISRKGKGAADAVWDADTFGEWSEGVFNVLLPQSHGEDASPDTRSLSRSGSS